MKDIFLRILILSSVLSSTSISISFGQVMEWPDEFAGNDTSEVPLHIMYFMGGEYNKAILKLEDELPKVARLHGTNSVPYLNLQYHQWISHHYTQQKVRASQIRMEMQTQAHKLPEDSLLRHLLYKSWLDTQIYSTLISGATMTELMRESDDPILRSLGKVSAPDQQAYFRKMAAGAEVMEKYEEQEEADEDQMALEMYGAMHGEEGANDLAELMKLAEGGKDLSNEEAIQQLLKMGDNSLISSYLPLLKGLEGLDEDSSPEEALALAKEAERMDTESTVDDIN